MGAKTNTHQVSTSSYLNPEKIALTFIIETRICSLLSSGLKGQLSHRLRSQNIKLILTGFEIYGALLVIIVNCDRIVVVIVKRF